MEKIDSELGLTSARLILEGWDTFKPARKQHIENHVREFIERILNYCDSHILPPFAFGYIYGIEEKNIPELNNIIKPIVKMSEYKRRKKYYVA